MLGYTDHLITELITAHVIDELRGYQGNLALAPHIAQNKWLLPVDDAGTQRHLETFDSIWRRLDTRKTTVSCCDLV
jgi:hypothetical protein